MPQGFCRRYTSYFVGRLKMLMMARPPGQMTNGIVSIDELFEIAEMTEMGGSRIGAALNGRAKP